MEKRLTAQGPKSRKSFTVTLPIEWVKEQKLDRTRAVDLAIVGNKAIISSGKNEAKRVIIDMADYSKNTVKIVQGCYRAGIDEVLFKSDDSKILQEITEIMEQRLIGYEVIEQRRDSILVKDIANESSEDFKVIFRRILLLILELSETNDIVQVKTLDRNINKLINYCFRILMKRGHTDYSKTHLYYLVLDRLEKVSDEFRWLYEDTLPINSKIQDIDTIKKLLRSANELFFKFDAKNYSEFQFLAYQLRKKIRFLEKTSKETIFTYNLSRLLNSLYGDIFTINACS